ncbi:MAG: cobalamin-independent methionine synthase II family protein [Pseudomonadota bacterium]
MNRSDKRILTTHVGSLPRPAELVAAYGQAIPDAKALEQVLESSVRDVVKKQLDTDITIVNDGEFGKPVHGEVDYGAWMTYLASRMSGFDIRHQQTGMFPGKDREEFHDFYCTHAVEIGEIRPVEVVCTAPVRYTGHADVRRDLANFRAALGDRGTADAFVPMASPTSLESLQPNEYYKTQEEYAWALATAMKEEYEEAAKAGFIVQVDDPGIWVLWDFWFAGKKSFEEFHRFAEARIEMLNFALSGIAPEQIRYHVCWGSWHGPHKNDAPLAGFIDLLFKLNVGAYCVEAANVRHETDWKVWREHKLPEGRILIPGVVTHSTNLLEPPELVADRIVRYARLVGRENVIAGTDCGLGGRVHPTIAWAKLATLAQGAELASRELWG